MNKVLDIAKKVHDCMASMLEQDEIIDYRVRVDRWPKINVKVIVLETEQIDFDQRLGISTDTYLIDIEEIEEDEFKFDRGWQIYFETYSRNEVDFTARRSIRGLIQSAKTPPAFTPFPDMPIVCFYSYKGGVGRTTALASFAAHYATHNAQTVVLLDCDFEAPGMLNYFGLTDVMSSQNQGVVEYLTDSVFCKESPLTLSDYYLEVSRDYSGAGQLFVFPAGNLDNTPAPNLHPYLEGFARLDLHNGMGIQRHFKRLLTDIHQSLKPDVILLDTSSGFNDIFGNIGLYFGDMVLGFFGNTSQTQPGLREFVELAKQLPGKQFVAVNSVIPSLPYFTDFQQILAKTLQAFPAIASPESGGELRQVDVPAYYVMHNPILSRIGTSFEHRQDFIDYIKGGCPEYDLLFKAVEQLLEARERKESRKAVATD
jgi:cellulose biosynthesis protein BcsQ